MGESLDRGATFIGVGLDTDSLSHIMIMSQSVVLIAERKSILTVACSIMYVVDAIVLQRQRCVMIS